MNPGLALECDLGPRDFSARLKRRARGAGARAAARHRGRRALVLAAAIAVPALAAPRDWPAFAIDPAGNAAAVGPVALEPMPFERAGTSFPGSAFYYLAPEAPPLAPGAHWDGEPSVGPAARGLLFRGTALDRMRAETCLTQAIYYEAASEPDAGQRAVAQVVLNRVAHPAYPKTVCGVVYQGSDRPTGCQFTFTCDGALARAPDRLFWERAAGVARAALAGYVYAPVGLATHYHTIAVHPYWADSLGFVGTIGAHRFYRFGGPAGAAGLFEPALYRGGEPEAARIARGAGVSMPEATPDPVAIEQAYAAGMRTAATTAALPSAPAAPSPATTPSYAAPVQARGGDALYTAKALPAPGDVRPEYAHSGQWIARPGS